MSGRIRLGGGSYEEFCSVKQTTDGGYIVGGSSTSNMSGDKAENSNGGWDYWILKTDAFGNILWQNSIGGNIADKLYSMQQASDGGFVLGGSSRSNISGDKTENSNGHDDYWIVKIDSIGNIQWQNTIGGNHDDLLSTIIQTADGGYILGGNSNSSISTFPLLQSRNGVRNFPIPRELSKSSALSSKIKFTISFNFLCFPS